MAKLLLQSSVSPLEIKYPIINIEYYFRVNCVIDSLKRTAFLQSKIIIFFKDIWTLVYIFVGIFYGKYINQSEFSNKNGSNEFKQTWSVRL